jgi:hypothetical protein
MPHKEPRSAITLQRFGSSVESRLEVGAAEVAPTASDGIDFR